MTIFAQNKPMTEAELDRLGQFLRGYKSGKAMNVEELDGFFAALVAGPEVVMPSKYLPEVFGGEMADAHEFGSLEEANDILALLALERYRRHTLKRRCLPADTTRGRERRVARQ